MVLEWIDDKNVVTLLEVALQLSVLLHQIGVVEVYGPGRLPAWLKLLTGAQGCGVELFRLFLPATDVAGKTGTGMTEVEGARKFFEILILIASALNVLFSVMELAGSPVRSRTSSKARRGGKARRSRRRKSKRSRSKARRSRR